MKALTLWQPWASLMAWRAKRNETRSRNTTWRGPFAIHAATNFPKEARALCGEEPFYSVLRARLADTYKATYGRDMPHNVPSRSLADLLPVGDVLAFGELVNSTPTPKVNRVQLNCLAASGRLPQFPDFEFGNYEPGRFYYQVDKLRPILTRVPASGRQSMWIPDADLQAKILAAAGTWERFSSLPENVASGDAVCPVCRKPIDEHRYEGEIVDEHGHPYLRLLCSGQAVLTI